VISSSRNNVIHQPRSMAFVGEDRVHHSAHLVPSRHFGQQPWTKRVVHTSTVHVVFLDWSKAFDRVPHERLLSKLHFYGIRGALLRWTESFLVGRTQFVKFNGARSAPVAVTFGVVQGSVLGTTLFIISMADLPRGRSNLWQYAGRRFHGLHDQEQEGQ